MFWRSVWEEAVKCVYLPGSSLLQSPCTWVHTVHCWGGCVYLCKGGWWESKHQCYSVSCVMSLKTWIWAQIHNRQYNCYSINHIFSVFVSVSVCDVSWRLFLCNCWIYWSTLLDRKCKYTCCLTVSAKTVCVNVTFHQTTRLARSVFGYKYNFFNISFMLIFLVY